MPISRAICREVSPLATSLSSCFRRADISGDLLGSVVGRGAQGTPKHRADVPVALTDSFDATQHFAWVVEIIGQVPADVGLNGFWVMRHSNG